MRLAAPDIPDATHHFCSRGILLCDSLLACTAVQEAFSAPGGASAAGRAPAPLGDDSAAVALLCDLMAVFLQHGLVSSPPG